MQLSFLLVASADVGYGGCELLANEVRAFAKGGRDQNTIKLKLTTGSSYVLG